MEIWPYLKAARRRLWIVLLVPILALAAVLSLHALSPARHVATAYVFTPGLVGGDADAYPGTTGVANWVNDFTALATSPLVIRHTAQATHASARAIADGLSVSQVHESGQLKITYTSADPQQAQQVVTDIAARTLKALFGPQVDRAEAAVQNAEKTLTTASNKVLEAVAKTGSTTPRQLYATTAQALSDLRQRKDQEDKAGHSKRVAALTRQIHDTAARLSDLGALAMKYQTLKAQERAAATSLETAQQDLRAKQAQYESATADNAVTLLRTTSPGLTSLILKALLPAIVLGLFIGLALAAAWEAWDQRRRTLVSPTHPEGRQARAPGASLPNLYSGNEQPPTPDSA